MMRQEHGRFEGEIRVFEELYDPKKTNQLPGGFKFTAVAEWLPDLGGWLSVCTQCKNFRCLVVDPVKQKWWCEKCNRSGPFMKPEPESRESQSKKVRNCLPGRKKKE